MDRWRESDLTAREFAAEIGADGFAKDAATAAVVAQELPAELAAAVTDAANGAFMAAMNDGFVISAVGSLNLPKLPDIPGMADFAGPSFHSARWDHSVDHRGKKVAMIGIENGYPVGTDIGRITIYTSADDSATTVGRGWSSMRRRPRSERRTAT